MRIKNQSFLDTIAGLVSEDGTGSKIAHGDFSLGCGASADGRAIAGACAKGDGVIAVLTRISAGEPATGRRTVLVLVRSCGRVSATGGAVVSILSGSSSAKGGATTAILLCNIL